MYLSLNFKFSEIVKNSWYLSKSFHFWSELYQFSDDLIRNQIKIYLGVSPVSMN